MEILRWILFNYAISACIWILNYSVDNKQLHITRTLNFFRHNYRPVLRILTAICLSPGSSGGSYQYSTNTFIYSLKNYRGYGYFKNDVSSYQHATYDYYGYGPTFGGGHDIYIADNARYNSNSYFYCSSYTSSYCDNSIWTGGMYFSPGEVEVYYEMLV